MLVVRIVDPHANLIYKRDFIDAINSVLSKKMPEHVADAIEEKIRFMYC